jgi:hypothetical protein
MGVVVERLAAAQTFRRLPDPHPLGKPLAHVHVVHERARAAVVACALLGVAEDLVRPDDRGGALVRVQVCLVDERSMACSADAPAFATRRLR